jgi:hypothetical protein
MINLYPLHPTSSFCIWPNVVNNHASSSFDLQVVQDYDQSSTTFKIQKINTPNRLSEMLVFNALSGSEGYPTKDGQYTATTIEYSFEAKTWGTFDSLFANANTTFGEGGIRSGSTEISVDRAYVHGTNLQTITTNTSTDQTGAYTTYNG